MEKFKVIDEILYRGFNTDLNGNTEILLNGEIVRGFWLTGGFHRHQTVEICPVRFSGESLESKQPTYEYFIVVDGMADWGMAKPIQIGKALPETIGNAIPYVRDINGKRIFKGDVVERIAEKTGSKRVIIVRDENDIPPSGFIYLNVYEQICTNFTYRVLGTIWDRTDRIKEWEEQNNG